MGGNPLSKAGEILRRSSSFSVSQPENNPIGLEWGQDCCPPTQGSLPKIFRKEPDVKCQKLWIFHNRAASSQTPLLPARPVHHFKCWATLTQHKAFIFTSTSISFSTHRNHRWPTGALSRLRHVSRFNMSPALVSHSWDTSMRSMHVSLTCMLRSDPWDPCIQTPKTSLSVTEPLVRRECQK